MARRPPPAIADGSAGRLADSWNRSPCAWGWALAAPLMVIAAPAPAAAQQATFDVAPQPLGDALTQAARQAGIQILFPHDAVRGRTSARLRGRMSVRVAIERLIAGSGLQIVSARARVVTLRQAPATRQARPARRPALVAHTQPRPAPPSEPPADIVVTGRPLASPLARAQASYAISVIEGEALAANTTRSVAELLRLVPGFWIESSGGEAANNVRARGIPTDGFSSVAIEENGLPVQYDGALGFLNTDQSFRIDETVARVEAVRGGPSSIFSPSAPGGVVNFITRNGIDHPGSLGAATLGEHGLARIDGYVSRPIGDHAGLLIGGFYRVNQGRRDAGFRADQGGQLRANLLWRDGRRELSVDLKHLDDRVAFYLPVPLAFAPDGSVTDVPGFDPLKDTLAGPDTNGVMLRSASGNRRFDLDRGTEVALTSITLAAKWPVTEHWSVNSRARWRTSETQRNALFPTGSPTPAPDFVTGLIGTARAAFPGTAALALRYAGDGTAYDGGANGLVLGANLMAINLPMDEFVTDHRLTGTLHAGGEHQLAIGVSYAAYRFGFHRYTSTALLSVEGQARRLDIIALDSVGAVIGRITDNGIQRYGSVFDDAQFRTYALALYLADEWQVTPALRLDLGLRAERETIRGSTAHKAIVDLGDPTTLADNAVTTSAGTRTRVSRRYSHTGWTLGANWQLSRGSGVFARYTETFRLPSAGEFIGQPLRQDQAAVPIRMAEAGIKYATPRISLFATAFHTRFDRLPFADFRFDTTTNAYVERVAIASTRAIGAEVEALFRPAGPFDLSLVATLQDSRYHDFAVTEQVGGAPVMRDYGGNRLVRIPALALRATPAVNLWGGSVRLQAQFSHFSQRYADVANSRQLPAYSLIDLSASTTLNGQTTLNLQVDNVTNTLGLTEGNPRTGAFEAGDPTSRYFAARPEFGRAWRATLRRKF